MQTNCLRVNCCGCRTLPKHSTPAMTRPENECLEGRLPSQNAQGLAVVLAACRATTGPAGRLTEPCANHFS